MIKIIKVQNFILDAGDLHKTRVSIYINKRSQVGIFHCTLANAENLADRTEQLLTTWPNNNRSY
jgi:hypothetical protein